MKQSRYFIDNEKRIEGCVRESSLINVDFHYHYFNELCIFYLCVVCWQRFCELTKMVNGDDDHNDNGCSRTKAKQRQFYAALTGECEITF